MGSRTSKQEEDESKPQNWLEKLEARMSSDLHREYVKIRDRLADIGAKDARVNYDLGSLVARARKGKAYGTGAVEQLALALDKDDSTLREYEKVATTWSETEFAGLLRRKSMTSLPITMSHLIVIAHELKRFHEEYISAVLDDGLSVRGLKARIAKRDKLIVPDDAKPASLSQRFRYLKADAETWREGVKNWKEEVAAIEPRKLEAPDRASLEEVLQEQEELAKELRELMMKVRAVLGDAGDNHNGAK